MENVQVAKRIDMHKVPASMLRIVSGLNIRTDYGNIEELAASIKENGVKVPMRGFRGKDEAGNETFVITDGHRRQQACQLLLDQGIEVMVPFILEAKGYNEEQRLIDMFIMNEGKSLTPLEQAEGVKRLINYMYSEKEIAQKLGKSEGYIRKLNSLNTAPKAFINLIQQGTISATLAIATIAEGKVEEMLAKVSTSAGTEIKAEGEAEMNQATDGKAITVAKAGTSKKITAKDIASLNSVKEFKNYMKTASEDVMDENVLYIYQFATKLINNELTGDQIKTFFA